MNKLTNKRLLKPSGINAKFYGSDLPFNEYIQLMQNIIVEGRADLTAQNAHQVVEANSPFSIEPELPPTHRKIQNGVLLIHGLFDSPFYLKDLSEYFIKRNFLVRAILLPGHGTVPGDLLNIDHNEWLKAVKYGVDTLNKEVENIFLAGYSLGGMLALHQLLYEINVTINGVILFAPAIKPRSRVKHFLAKHYHLFSWVSDSAKWYQIREMNNYTKYSCYAFNAGAEACKVIDRVAAQLREKNITTPLFIVISQDDETICHKAILSFFSRQPNPKNKLLIYTNQEMPQNDNRIIKRTSYYPNLKIIDFSHTCITISPKNPLLGEESEFLDLHHYADISKIKKNELYLGAVTKTNLKNFRMSRLSYNPDFENLLANLDSFLDSIV